MLILNDRFQIDPDRALRMPWRRFQALQKAAFRLSVADRNRQMAAERNHTNDAV